jgi:hypothetical protein
MGEKPPDKDQGQVNLSGGSIILFQRLPGFLGLARFGLPFGRGTYFFLNAAMIFVTE